MTTNTTNSQAVPEIDVEFVNLMSEYRHAESPEDHQRARRALVNYHEAKLAQAHLEKQVAESAAEIEAKDRDEWKTRAEKAMDDVADHYKRLCKAEAKLAEWDKIVEVSLAQDYATRAIAAESRLAEIQRGVEGLTRWMETFEDGLCQAIRNDPPSNDVFVRLTSVLALLQPQGQADTSGLPG